MPTHVLTPGDNGFPLVANPWDVGIHVYPEKTFFVSNKFAGYDSPYYQQIPDAVEAAANYGGGLVIIYPGVYELSYELELPGGVFLDVRGGATIKFTGLTKGIKTQGTDLCGIYGEGKIECENVEDYAILALYGTNCYINIREVKGVVVYACNGYLGIRKCEGNISIGHSGTLSGDMPIIDVDISYVIGSVKVYKCLLTGEIKDIYYESGLPLLHITHQNIGSYIVDLRVGCVSGGVRLSGPIGRIYIAYSHWLRITSGTWDVEIRKIDCAQGDPIQVPLVVELVPNEGNLLRSSIILGEILSSAVTTREAVRIGDLTSSNNVECEIIEGVIKHSCLENGCVPYAVLVTAKAKARFKHVRIYETANEGIEACCIWMPAVGIPETTTITDMCTMVINGETINGDSNAVMWEGGVTYKNWRSVSNQHDNVAYPPLVEEILVSTDVE